MATAFIGLGSNLGDRRSNIEAALQALAREGATIRRTSRFILTAPEGVADQPEFMNAVAEIETDLSAFDLMRLMLRIESRLGRLRTMRWGPRTIDLDLLLYDRCVIREADLQVPHPRMHQRRFVLEPLVEIAPDAWHPVLQKTARELLKELSEGPSA